MHCKVTIDMLNPTTRVKEQPTVVQYGEITDVYKYLSNGGSPSIGRTTSLLEMLSPEVCAGGLVCFEEPYSNSLFFDCRNKPVAYGTDINANTTLPSITLNTKIGMKLPSETVLEPGHYSRTWEFGTTQGNGTIKSLALTHKVAAHSFDSSTDMSAYSNGNVEDIYRTYTQFGLLAYEDLSLSYNCYVSENYIFLISEPDIIDPGIFVTDYVDVTFYIRRLPKNAFDYYPATTDKHYNRASFITTDYDFTRTLRIPRAYYTNNAILEAYKGSTSWIGRSSLNYCVFFSSKSSSSCYSDEPSISSQSSAYYTQFTFYVFSGDNCDITTYHMDNGCIALTSSSSSSPNAHTFNEWPSFVTEDLKLVYWVKKDTNTIYCRDITTGTLLWHLDMPSLPGALTTRFFTIPCRHSNLLHAGYSFQRKLPNSGNTRVAYSSLCIDLSNGAVVGTSLSDAENILISTSLAQSQNDLMWLKSGQTNASVSMDINYMIARVNLVSPIEKTSNYIMQVKFEMFID